MPCSVLWAEMDVEGPEAGPWDVGRKPGKYPLVMSKELLKMAIEVVSVPIKYCVFSIVM